MALLRQNSVQQKVSCIFKIKIEDKSSNKRENQSFRVTASDEFDPHVTDKDLETAKPTEKLDGTCCYITDFEGKPWLWARLDRKPNKVGERKLKKYLSQKDAWHAGGEVGDKPTIMWDVMTDFKDVPVQWKPALEVPVEDGVAQPDSHGHIPGWVPVNPRERQHLWHLSAVDLDKGLGLVLNYSEDSGLSVDCVSLSELSETTLELIGTNVNGNPYKLGTKQKPIHLLVVHGTIPVTLPRPLSRDALMNWFENTSEGRVEGIVWHCDSGALFKLHRHHLCLPWPIETTCLSERRVKINVDGSAFEISEDNKNLFYLLSKHHEASCDHLHQLPDLIYTNGFSAVNIAMKVAPVVAGAILAPLAVPVVLGAAGFGAGGIVAGSVAARAMSAAAVANGGGVAAGSFVAVCQSVGAAGLGATGTAVASTVGASIGGLGQRFANWVRSDT